MNRKLCFLLLLVLIPLYLLPAQNTTKKSYPKNKILNSKSDTLSLGYTYWQSDSGPFTGACGNKYALVFLGTISTIYTPTFNTKSLYTPQKGTIKITEILKKENLTKKQYSTQKYISSDCFYNTGLQKGDSVIVFCYEYEGSYSISKKAIVKIKKEDAPLIVSIKKYINSQQDPLSIEKDIILWEEKGFGNELKQIIECKKFFENKR